MIYVGIDASFNSLGYCICDVDRMRLEIGTINTDKYRGAKIKRKYEHWLYNTTAICNALITKLAKYRRNELIFGIEEIAIGFHKVNTNSTYNLVFEVSSIATTMQRYFGPVVWVAPSHHKKLLTGKGKATKEDSVTSIISKLPYLRLYANEKLDDVADAFAIMLTLLPAPVKIEDFEVIVDI